MFGEGLTALATFECHETHFSREYKIVCVASTATVLNSTIMPSVVRGIKYCGVTFEPS